MASNQKTNEDNDGDRTPTKVITNQSAVISEFDLIKEVAVQMNEYYAQQQTKEKSRPHQRLKSAQQMNLMINYNQVPND